MIASEARTSRGRPRGARLTLARRTPLAHSGMRAASTGDGRGAVSSQWVACSRHCSHFGGDFLWPASRILACALQISPVGQPSRLPVAATTSNKSPPSSHARRRSSSTGEVSGPGRMPSSGLPSGPLGIQVTPPSSPGDRGEALLADSVELASDAAASAALLSGASVSRVSASVSESSPPDGVGVFPSWRCSRAEGGLFGGSAAAPSGLGSSGHRGGAHLVSPWPDVPRGP